MALEVGAVFSRGEWFREVNKNTVEKLGCCLATGDPQARSNKVVLVLMEAGAGGTGHRNCSKQIFQKNRQWPQKPDKKGSGRQSSQGIRTGI